MKRQTLVVTIALVATASGMWMLLPPRRASVQAWAPPLPQAGPPRRAEPGRALHDTLPDGTHVVFAEPKVWNGSVLVDANGVLEGGQKSLAAVALARGFAIARPVFEGGYWEMNSKLARMQTLRRDIDRRFGGDVRVYLSGLSEGAYRVLAELEQHPNDYRGGVAFCALAPIDFGLPGSYLDLMVAFDHYFPGILTTPGGTLAQVVAASPGLQGRARALGQNSDRAADLARRFGLDPGDLSGVILNYASVMHEIQEGAGGNPFDTSQRAFEAFADDPEFLKNVRRFSADAAALQRAAARLYTMTGRLGRPALIVGNSYDPLLPMKDISAYAARVGAAGSGDRLVVNEVAGRGHCTFSLGEEVDAIDRLVAWAQGGTKPPSGRLTAATVVEPEEERRPPAYPDGVWQHIESRMNGRVGRSPVPFYLVFKDGIQHSVRNGVATTSEPSWTIVGHVGSYTQFDAYTQLGDRWFGLTEVVGDRMRMTYLLPDDRAYHERPVDFTEAGQQIQVYRRVSDAGGTRPEVK